jgi:predicted transposase YbfD/YdcC
MQCIILKANEVDGIVFNLADLAQYLNQLTDPRDKRGKVYDLGTILSMIVLARLSGQDKPYGIFEWIKNRQEALVTIFSLKRKRIPCLNTLRTILGEVVSLDELEQALRHYLNLRYGGQSSVFICIDGKTMRGTIPKGYTQGVHLLSAYLAEDGIVLKQVAVESKENEISASGPLLDELYLKGKVVCADAMHTQRAFCVQILSGGGDYLLFAKKNQSTLLADIEQFFVPPRPAAGWHIAHLPRTVASCSNKSHGRIERRTLTLIADDDRFVDWPGLEQVFQLERYTKKVTTGVETYEIVYGLTSCSPHKADAAQVLNWTRLYWQIENGIHHRRDVTLQEDATRISKPPLAQAISIINNFVIGLVNKLGYANLASARRYFDASIALQMFQ